MQYRVIFYYDEKGRSQAENFLDKIHDKERAKILKWMKKLEKEGPNLPRPYADTVKGKIRELRIQFGSNNYRFFYFFFNKTIIITHGFCKKTDKVPMLEVKKSERIMYRFLSRIKKGEKTL